MNTDIRRKITDSIVKAIEEGNTLPWQCPWNFGVSNAAIPTRATGETYRGINVLILWAEQMNQGFVSNTWMTFKQANEKGGKIRKGSKSTQIVFYKPIVIKGSDDGEEDDKTIPLLRTYNVFNIDQIDGLPEKFYPSPIKETEENKNKKLYSVEQFIESLGAEIHFGGNRAFYSPTHDFIGMPDLKYFDDTESYYATLAHEHIHWTNHKTRLDRHFDGPRGFGTEAYAMEELVAEIGSAFLCAELNIEPECREDHKSYIASWLKVLKGDKNAIFRAAACAQRAVDFLHDLNKEEIEAEQEVA